MNSSQKTAKDSLRSANRSHTPLTPDVLADILSASKLGEMTAVELSHALLSERNVDASKTTVNNLLYSHRDKTFEIKRLAGACPIWGLTEKAAASRARPKPKNPAERLIVFVDAGSTPDVLQMNEDLGGVPLQDMAVVVYVDADYQGKLPTSAGVTIKRGTQGRPALDLDLSMALNACETRRGMNVGDHMALVGKAGIIASTARVLSDLYPRSSEPTPLVDVYDTWTACRNACL